MIQSQALMISLETKSRAHENSRPTYGKIKIVPPRGRQAIGAAGLLAGASVGARAARKRKTNRFSTVSGTRQQIAS